MLLSLLLGLCPGENNSCAVCKWHLRCKCRAVAADAARAPSMSSTATTRAICAQRSNHLRHLCPAHQPLAPAAPHAPSVWGSCASHLRHLRHLRTFCKRGCSSRLTTGRSSKESDIINYVAQRPQACNLCTSTLYLKHIFFIMCIHDVWKTNSLKKWTKNTQKCVSFEMYDVFNCFRYVNVQKCLVRHEQCLI